MKGLHQIIENRRHKKPYYPDNAFMSRLRMPAKILLHMDVAGTPQQVRYEMRRMYVVVLCTAFEIFWRESLKLAIDEARLGESDLKHLTKVSLSISDVAWIAGRKVSMGELIASSYMFQSVDVVTRAFSDVFQIDAAKLIAKREITVISQGEKGRLSSERLRIPFKRAFECQAAIEQCFRVRHETVHNFGRNFRLSSTQLNKFSLSIWTFCKLASIALSEEIFPRMTANVYARHMREKGRPLTTDEIKEIFGKERRRMITRNLKRIPLHIPIQFLLGHKPTKKDLYVDPKSVVRKQALVGEATMS